MTSSPANTWKEGSPVSSNSPGNEGGETDKLTWLRQQALDEIIATEKQYLMQKAKDVLSPVHRRDIFHGLDAVVGVAKMFLQELQATPVHMAFMKVASFFKVYTAYCAGYNGSIVALTQSRKASKDWDKYLKETENTQQTSFLSLASFLIKPVQRICRYPLMLKEILKHTQPTHAEYELLAEALAQIEKITDHVNEGKRIAENMQRIVEIYNSFTDKEKPDICSPTRILIREGELMKLSDGRLQTRHFFLFNDTLVYAKPTLLKKSEGLWVFCGQWSLDKIQIVDVPPPNTPTSSPNIRNSSDRSAGSEIIRNSGGGIRTSATEIFPNKTASDIESSPSLSPASTASSSPFSSASLSSASPSPSLSGTRHNSLTGSQKNSIPIINLTPPVSPSSSPVVGRKHSHTDAELPNQQQKSGDNLRVVAMSNVKEKRRSQEMAKEKVDANDMDNPRIDHKRSLSEHDLLPSIPRDFLGKNSNPENGKTSLNRTLSIEHQKLIASLPEYAQHCFIVYAPVLGKLKRYIICAPDQNTKNLWFNDLLIQWRKASMLSQTRAARLVSRELGDHLDSISSDDEINGKSSLTISGSLKFGDSKTGDAKIRESKSGEFKLDGPTASETSKTNGPPSEKNKEKPIDLKLKEMKKEEERKEITASPRDKTREEARSAEVTRRLDNISKQSNESLSIRAMRKNSADVGDTKDKDRDKINGKEKTERQIIRTERSPIDNVVSRLEIPERNDSNDKKMSSSIERGDRSARGERSERSIHKERSERSEKNERSDRNDKKEGSDRNERTDRNGRSDRNERTERTEKTERSDRNEKPDRNESNDRSDRRERSDRERKERSERSDRDERRDADQKSSSDRRDKDKSRRDVDRGYKSDRSDRGYKSDISGSDWSERSERSDSDRSDRERSERHRRERERERERERTKYNLLEKERHGDKRSSDKEDRERNKERRERDRNDHREESRTTERSRGSDRERDRDRDRNRDGSGGGDRDQEATKGRTELVRKESSKKRDDELRDLTCEEENEELWAHIQFLEVCKEERKGERKGGERREEKGKQGGTNEEKSASVYGGMPKIKYERKEKSGGLQTATRKPKGSS